MCLLEMGSNLIRYSGGTKSPISKDKLVGRLSGAMILIDLAQQTNSRVIACEWDLERIMYLASCWVLCLEKSSRKTTRHPFTDQLLPI